VASESPPPESQPSDDGDTAERGAHVVSDADDPAGPPAEDERAAPDVGPGEEPASADAEHGSDDLEHDDGADGDVDGEDAAGVGPSPRSSAVAFTDEVLGLAGGQAIDDEGPVHVYSALTQTRDDAERGVGIDYEGGEKLWIYTLAPDVADDDDAVRAFNDAASAWNGISHNAHISSVAEVGDSPRPWIAFEGGELTLAEASDSMDDDVLLDIVTEAAEAFQKASLYKVDHGAIRPEVVHLQSTDTRTAIESAALSDWGITPDVHEAVGESLLTPYTAPEELREDGSTDRRTDVYKLGALAYWAVTGRPPFDDATVLDEAILHGVLTPPMDEADVSAELNDVIVEALEREPEDRYDSPLALQDALRAATE
jgi:hypothetical protein